MSLLKADTIKPVTSGGDLSLQGDSGGSAVDCLNITSAGDINFTGNTDAKRKKTNMGKDTKNISMFQIILSEVRSSKPHNNYISLAFSHWSNAMRDK